MARRQTSKMPLPKHILTNLINNLLWEYTAEIEPEKEFKKNH